MADLIIMSNHSFTLDQLIAAEQSVLSAVKFDVYLPSRYFFSSRILAVALLSDRETMLVQFFMELSLMVSDSAVMIRRLLLFCMYWEIHD